MSGTDSVILLEFNELSPPLMARFMAEGRLPNFSRLYHESRVYVTDAQESGRYLQPWIQWVTVHSGLTAGEHGVCELGEAHKLGRQCLTEIVSAAGLRVWNCGSMNARYDERINGCVLPDPWTTGVQPHPDALLPYFRFIQKSVQEHTSGDQALAISDYVAFSRFMVTHGLSLSTGVAIVRQLLRERHGKYKWMRVAVMDRLQWDVFRWYYKRVRPNFATFFLNSTAHLQHKYWRNLEPERFRIRPTAEEQAELEKAIPFGYEQMDRLVGNFMKLADEGTTLIFCTALSQQPCLVYEDSGGKTFYRTRGIDKLLQFAGVTTACRYFPVMSEEFHLRFENEAHARVAHRRLTSLRVEDKPALDLRCEGSQLFGGCHVFTQLPGDAVLRSEETGASKPFFDFFYQAQSLKSGMHHPDGMLWIRLPDGRHAVTEEKGSLVSIAPTVLHLLDVPVPTWMNGAPLVTRSSAGPKTGAAPVPTATSLTRS